MNNKILLLIVILITLLLSGCGFRPFEELVDAEKSQFYYYTATKTDVVYKYRESLTGINLWWRRTKLDADAKSFVVLSKYYAKDKNSGYYLGGKFDADTESLVVMNENYAKDKNNGYYREFKFDADGESLEFVGRDFCKDKDRVYSGGIKITNADAATFTIDKNVVKDKNYVFRNKFSNVEEGIFAIIEGADPATYEKIGGNWAKDKSHYYFYDTEMDVDHNTFRFLDKGVAVDKDNIYYFAGMPSYGHGKTYKHTGEVHYIARGVFYDKRNIYNFRIRPVFAEPIENSETLQVVDTTKNVVFFVDKTLYWNMKERDTSNIDIETFKTDGNYATDKNRIYYSGFEIIGADKNTFEKVHDIFSKDANHVYKMWEIFPEADPATFKYVSVEKGKSYYQDKNHKWKYDTREGVWKTFE